MIRKQLVVGILLGVVGLSLLLALIVPRQTLQPTVGGANGVVGIVRIEGEISDQSAAEWMAGGGGTWSVNQQLRRAREDSTVRAVVIRINSPGGSAAAAQEIAAEVERLQQTGKPVVASLGDVAASGGYWIAAQADQVVAVPATLTGSIGVIMEWPTFEKLLKNLGVGSEVIKSGPRKDMGSATRPLSPEERSLLQAIVDEEYQQFVEAVLHGRNGRISRERLLEVADGRIMSGRQAQQLGLVDQLGNFYDAVQLAAELAEMEGEAEIRELAEENPWRSLFSGLRGSFGAAEGWSKSEFWQLPAGGGWR